MEDSCDAVDGVSSTSSLSSRTMCGMDQHQRHLYLRRVRPVRAMRVHPISQYHAGQASRADQNSRARSNSAAASSRSYRRASRRPRSRHTAKPDINEASYEELVQPCGIDGELAHRIIEAPLPHPERLGPSPADWRDADADLAGNGPTATALAEISSSRFPNPDVPSSWPGPAPRQHADVLSGATRPERRAVQIPDRSVLGAHSRNTRI